MKYIVTNISKTAGLVELDKEKADIIGSFNIELIKEGMEALIKIHDIFDRPLDDDTEDLLDRVRTKPLIKVEFAFAKCGDELDPVLLMRLADRAGVGWMAVAAMKDHTIYTA